MNAVSVAGVILAAGKGTRMKSDLPKGLHAVCGLPMVEHVGRAMRGAGVQKPIMVIGHGGNLIQDACGNTYAYAIQEEQLGTGHALLMAREALAGYQGPLLVTPGDTPLLRSDALQQLVEHHAESGAAMTIATVELDDPKGYGRIIRDGNMSIVQIVEDKDATQNEKLVREINSGIYCFDAEPLFQHLPALQNFNASGEYYLTDIVRAFADADLKIETLVFTDEGLLRGVNDPWQLGEAAAIMSRQILKVHAENGVTIIDPATTFIGADVTIGVGTTLEPGTILEGATKIGSECHIGPFSRVAESIIADRCTILMSHVKGAKMASGSRCGPYANLRPGTVLSENVKIGNFVEIKNSTIGADASLSHLTYIGDASVGARSNIGAGTITCNYDGISKHRTEIGADTFIGSNSTLVAPITIGNGAMVAAGSVITQDVGDGDLALGRARQEVKIQWVPQWRERKQQAKQ